MNIGQRLKYARRSRKMTQNDLAERIGVSRGVITNIELEKVEAPQPIVITALCNALMIEPDWLMYGKGEMEVQTKSSENRAEVSNDLYSAIENLTNEEQILLLNVIKLIRQNN